MTTDEQATSHASRGHDRRWLRSLAVTVTLLVGMTLVNPLASVSAATPNSWSAPLGDSGNSRNNSGETAITAATASRVSTTWLTPDRSGTSLAPPVVNGVALRVAAPGNVTFPSYLQSLSPETGAVLDSLELPGMAQYHPGITVVGSLAVLPFHGYSRPGGVLVVDLQTRRIVWNRDLPPASISWMGNAQAGRAYSDGQRVFVSGAGNVINAYRLSDGQLLWTTPYTTGVQGTPNGVDGLAVGSGVILSSGDEGLLAHDAATGRRLWTAAVRGFPVVAGGRIYLSNRDRVTALPAAGCGRPTCTPSWTTSFPAGTNVDVGGADAATLFLTYQQDRSDDPDPAKRRIGVVARLTAATGRVEWSTTAGHATVGLIRGGDTIWLNNEYVDNGVIAQRILGFSARATGPAPLRTIPLTQNLDGFPQSLGIGAGTLFQQLNGKLVAYRVAASPMPPPNAAPTADFTVTVNGLSVLVDGAPSRDRDGEIKTYAWNLGNGVTGAGNISATTYATAGSYRITLTVTDWQGATGTTSRTVTVGTPPAAGVLAEDTFDRNSSGGLGAAPVGGAWTALYGASRQSTSGGSAHLSFTAPGTSVGAYLGGVSASSADITATVSLGQAPSGGGASYYLIGRRTGDNRDYRLRVRFLSDGSVRLTATVRNASASETFIGSEVIASQGYRPGTPLQLRFRVTGTGTTTLQGKAWTGGTEPSAWTLTRSDSTAALQGPGAVGMTGYLSGSARTVPVTFSVTDFRARPAG